MIFLALTAYLPAPPPVIDDDVINVFFSHTRTGETVGERCRHANGRVEIKVSRPVAGTSGHRPQGREPEESGREDHALDAEGGCCVFLGSAVAVAAAASASASASATGGRSIHVGAGDGDVDWAGADKLCCAFSFGG